MVLLYSKRIVEPKQKLERKIFPVDAYSTFLTGQSVVLESAERSGCSVRVVMGAVLQHQLPCYSLHGREAGHPFPRDVQAKGVQLHEV
jgi:hypothetical protein